MRIFRDDLPVSIEGVDATEVALQVRDEAGNVVFKIMGDGSIAAKTFSPDTPQHVADGANVATVITALKALGIFVT